MNSNDFFCPNCKSTFKYCLAGKKCPKCQKYCLHINDFPREVLKHIFGFLPPNRHSYYNVPFVSKHFKNKFHECFKKPILLHKKLTACAVQYQGENAIILVSYNYSCDIVLLMGNVSKVLRGHTDFVNRLAIAADGKTAVSAACDRTIIVWDLTTDKGIKARQEHTSGYITGVAIAAASEIVVFESADKTVKVWDYKTGECRVLQGHTDLVNGVAVTADGKTAISGADDKTVRVWDLATGECRVLQGHTGWVKGVAVTADGKTAISGDLYGYVMVWDLATGKCINILYGEEYTHSVIRIAIAADGKTAVSEAYDGTIIVWDLATGKLKRKLQETMFVGRRKADSIMIRCVAIAADGGKVIYESEGRLLEHVDVKQADIKIIEKIENNAHTKDVLQIAISANEKRVISVSDDNTIIVWDRQARTCRKLSSGGTCCAITADGEIGIVGLLDNTIGVLELETGNLIKKLAGHTEKITCVAIAADRKTVISGSVDKTVRVWDYITGERRVLQGHTSRITCVAIAEDMKTFISGEWYWSVIVWDLATGKCIKVLRGHSHDVICVAIAADGKTAVSGAHDRTVIVWDLANGKLIGKLQEPEFVGRRLENYFRSIKCVAIAANAKQVRFISPDRTLISWNWETGSRDILAKNCSLFDRNYYMSTNGYLFQI